MTQLLAITPKSSAPAASSYARLREQVRQTLLVGQRKIEQQKVLTYWETGKQINDYLKDQRGKNGYGDNVVAKLAEDLDLDDRILYQCMQFAASDILHRGAKSLTWAHYRAALRIQDPVKRKDFLKKAEQNGWTAEAFSFKVTALNAERASKDPSKKIERLPFVCLGPFYTYQVIQPETIHSRSQELLLDLGFSHALEMDQFREKYPAGTLVSCVKDAKGNDSLKKFSAPSSVLGTPDDLLYTYKAFVERVIDGDTLKVEFDLGFGSRQRETIRLRYIDAPEIDTPEGKAAKRFVERELASCDFITVKSMRTPKEKWGRYLGSVFLPRRGVKTSQGVLAHEREYRGGYTYLNQIMLNKGHAVKIFN